MTAPKPAGLPLEGIRVLELSQAIVLPAATIALGGMGADIIKVESGGRPDQTRGGPQPENVRRPQAYNHSGHFQMMNRNKRGLTLDLASPRGREVFLRLVAVSDVVAENFTSRVLTNLRLEYETLREVNPRIILMSSNGFGHSGPWKDYKAWGPNIESVDGLMLLTAYSDGVPQRAGSGGLGVTYPDVAGAYFGAYSVLAALEQRERTGEGQWLQLSHYEAGVATIPEAVLEYTMTGRLAQPLSNRERGRAPQGAYPCDGADRWIAISVETDAQFAALAAHLGVPGLAGDARFATYEARWANHDALDALLAEATRPHEPWALERALQGAGVEAAVVQTVKDVIYDPQLKHRGYFEMVPPPSDAPDIGYRPFIRPGWRSANSPAVTWLRGPGFGEHNHEVLTEYLSMTADEIAALEAEGVIASEPKDVLSREAVDLAGGLATGRLREVDEDYRDHMEQHFLGDATRQD
jgi:crotonobetainyl-CoA:carnitine CoA-transferase CaiB-like acyl-CoA transferase